MRYFLAIAVLLFGASTSAELPDNAVWIDVRTMEEYKSGHIDKAHLIPYDNIEDGIKALDIGKDTPLYLHCRSGRRSGLAKESLEKLGYTNVVNVGGLEDARALVNGKSGL